MSEAPRDFGPKITLRAKGHWKTILSTLGIDLIKLNGKHHACPVNGEGENRFRFSNYQGRGNFFCACNPQGKSDGFKLLECLHGWDFKAAAAEVEKVIPEQPAEEVDELNDERALNDLRMIQNAINETTDRDHVLSYLAGRSITRVPATVRQARVWYGLNRQGIRKPTDAMIVKFLSPEGKAATFHLTYLQQGKKAPFDCPRIMMTPALRMNGGAVRLWPMRGDGVLGVAEGVETALSAMELFDVPTWATLNANMMEQFVPPKECKRLVIYGDNDKSFTGQAAAFALAKRCVTQHRIEAEVIIPTMIHRPDNSDLNDWLQKKRGEQ
jgi:putative DNA primase/helicase